VVTTSPVKKNTSKASWSVLPERLLFPPPDHYTIFSSHTTWYFDSLSASTLVGSHLLPTAVTDCIGVCMLLWNGKAWWQYGLFWCRWRHLHSRLGYENPPRVYCVVILSGPVAVNCRWSLLHGFASRNRAGRNVSNHYLVDRICVVLYYRNSVPIDPAD
jgi:hypothetical protein